MAKAKILKEKYWGKGVISYICPGCGHQHIIYTNPENPAPNKERSCWGFSGNLDSPTFTPSVLYRMGSHVPELTEKQKAYCNAQGEGYNLTCHSYVTQGQVQILADSTYNPNKTLDIPEIAPDIDNDQE